MPKLLKDQDLNQASFDCFLDWLDADREEAARKYEAIRRELIRFFDRHVGADAEDLADLTINVVIVKAPGLARTYVGEPRRYFFRVAHLKRLEYIRKQALWAQPRKDGGNTGDGKDQDNFLNNLPDPHSSSSAMEKEVVSACLHECLPKISPEEREILLLYYRDDKWASPKDRDELAARFGLSIGALRLQIHRLKGRLRDCILDCRRREIEQLIFS